jgi:hypothetical protein
MKKLITIPFFFAFFLCLGQTNALKNLAGTYMYINSGVKVEIVLSQNNKASLTSDLNGVPIKGVNSKGIYSLIKGNKIKVIWQKAAFNKTMGDFEYDSSEKTLEISNGNIYINIEKYKSSVIGEPITVGNFLVAQNDFPKRMNWDDAKRACANLGRGWRLPTKDELNILYQNRDKIGGHPNESYISSTESDRGFKKAFAWSQSFRDGKKVEGYKDTNWNYHVRAIRTF